MYAYLKGTLAYYRDSYAVLDVGGVGYLVGVSPRVSDTVKAGDVVQLFTYQAVREDGMYLYGFLTDQERIMFEKLISISGVGPKAAMSVLSAMDLSSLAAALLSSDGRAFSRVPGIGPKTAGRIILELKDKVDVQDILGTTLVAAGSDLVQAGAAGEAMEALISLGYARNEAAQAVAAVRDLADTTEELTLMALKRLSM